MPADLNSPGRINQHGAYICGPCSSGRHLGVNHGGSQYALCQCTCDGIHRKDGSRKDERHAR